jgi:uncharacterized protein with gpF-like domain
MSKMPTVKFDASKVTETVKADLWMNVSQLDGIDESHCAQIYEAALRSIEAGRNLSLLFNAIMQMNVDGMTTRRAEEMTHYLTNKTTALMTEERQVSLGIRQAKWHHSGAPCGTDPKNSTTLDAAHRTADGKLFDPAKGLLLNGKWTWPGAELGCRCFARSIVPGFS